MERASNPSKVLITGTSGFTGQHLAKALLDADYEIHALVRHGSLAISDTKIAKLITCHEVDFQSLESLKTTLREIQPDYIYHLAGISFAAHGDATEIYAVNVILTDNLLKATQTTCPNIKKIILASSANVYGNPIVEIVDENEQLQPVNHYGCSKASMEYMAQTFADSLPVIIVRPFNYTGRGQATKFLVPKIVDHFHKRKSEIELGNIEISRDFSDVRDVVKDYISLAESEVTEGVFNVCSGRSFALKEIIRILQDIQGYEIKINVNPAFVRATDIKKLQGDNTALLNIIKTRKRIELEETLLWMLHDT